VSGCPLEAKDLGAPRAHRDTTDTSAELQNAPLASSVAGEFVVGVAIGLPTTTPGLRAFVRESRGAR